MKLTGRNAVVVDGHPLWLDGMARLLEGAGIQVLARTTRPDEVVELVRSHEPHVLVVGLGPGPADKELLDAARTIRLRQPDVKLVLLAPAADARAIDEAFAIGVSAYCIKSAEPDDLVAAIRQSFDQSIFLATLRAAPETRTEVAARADGDSDGQDLTKRETEILRLVAEGSTNSQLARMLWVTEQTVKFHLSNIYRKLNVANRTEASRWAQVHGLLAASDDAGSASATHASAASPN